MASSTGIFAPTSGVYFYTRNDNMFTVNGNSPPTNFGMRLYKQNTSDANSDHILDLRGYAAINDSSDYALLLHKWGIHRDGQAGLQFGRNVGDPASFSYYDILPIYNGVLNDGQVDLGSGSYRFDGFFATTGSINTSDRNAKKDIQELNASELNVARKLKTLVRKYKFKKSKEGEGKRWHIGVIAQDIEDAFTAEGLDAFEYGMLCKDEQADGSFIYSVRYDEIFAFIIAVL